MCVVCVYLTVIVTNAIVRSDLGIELRQINSLPHQHVFFTTCSSFLISIRYSQQNIKQSTQPRSVWQKQSYFSQMVFLCCYGDDKMSMCLHLSTMFVKSNINMSLYVINDSQYLNISLMHLFSAKHLLLLVCTLNMGEGG